MEKIILNESVDNLGRTLMDDAIEKVEIKDPPGQDAGRKESKLAVF